jgi:predicted O-methyltransferase YrrM
MRSEKMSNNLEERYSSTGAKYLAQQKYSEAIAFYKQSIETDPTLMSNYWHLCLALLLQEQESEAMATWLSILEKADIEEVNIWTLDLVKVIIAEAIRCEAVSDFESARKMYGYAAIARGEAWKKIKGYKFTDDWFSKNLPIWEQYLIHLASKPEINILEIGSWEGMSTCWLLDHILTHESSRITCIDTFEGSIEHKLEYNDSYIKSVQERFDFNISQTGVPNKVTKIVGSSQDVMRSLPLINYDMLYIDGSHLASDALTDAVLGWGLVKVGGVIVFDDYDYTFPDDLEQDTKIGIDAFLKVFHKKVNIIHQAHQVIVEKTLD